MVRSILAGVTLILALGASDDPRAEERTTNDAVYSREQAKAGEPLYKKHCLLCHDKKYFRPVFKARNGEPLSTFWIVMSTTMPESNPGSLRKAEYADILAYILSLNRYKSGDEPLAYEDGVLDTVTIAPRAK